MGLSWGTFKTLSLFISDMKKSFILMDFYEQEPVISFSDFRFK